MIFPERIVRRLALATAHAFSDLPAVSRPALRLARTIDGKYPGVASRWMAMDMLEASSERPQTGPGRAVVAQAWREEADARLAQGDVTGTLLSAYVACKRPALGKTAANFVLDYLESGAPLERAEERSTVFSAVSAANLDSRTIARCEKAWEKYADKTLALSLDEAVDDCAFGTGYPASRRRSHDILLRFGDRARPETAERSYLFAAIDSKGSNGGSPDPRFEEGWVRSMKRLSNQSYEARLGALRAYREGVATRFADDFIRTYATETLDIKYGESYPLTKLLQQDVIGQGHAKNDPLQEFLVTLWGKANDGIRKADPEAAEKQAAQMAWVAAQKDPGNPIVALAESKTGLMAVDGGYNHWKSVRYASKPPVAAARKPFLARLMSSGI